MVTLYLRSSLNSSHMSRIWLVVLVLDHGLLYPPGDTRLVYKVFSKYETAVAAHMTSLAPKSRAVIVCAKLRTSSVYVCASGFRGLNCLKVVSERSRRCPSSIGKPAVCSRR